MPRIIRPGGIGDLVADLTARVADLEARAKTAAMQAAITPGPWALAPWSLWPQITSAAFTDVWTIRLRRWQPWLVLAYAATTTVSGTTGQVRWQINGATVDASLSTVDFSTLGGPTVVVAAPSGAQNDIIDIRLQAVRTAGTGAVSCTPTEATSGPEGLAQHLGAGGGAAPALLMAALDLEPADEPTDPPPDEPVGDPVEPVDESSYGTAPDLPPVTVVDFTTYPKDPNPTG